MKKDLCISYQINYKHTTQLIIVLEVNKTVIILLITITEHKAFLYALIVNILFSMLWLNCSQHPLYAALNSCDFFFIQDMISKEFLPFFAHEKKVPIVNYSR